ncbi:metallophosphoesterase [Neobacillus terrae]|uniref:metallophosphoesterase n=1 Tax=Neobacillus terrae TaxID=3034837 RepID=UPI001FB0C456|nr:metallophosphoesterase [Neobacillus terrae]
MTSIRRMAQAAFFIILFNALLFYIGWNGWEWLNVGFGFKHPIFYTVVLLILSYSFILSRVSKFFSAYRTVGYVWFAIIQYCLLLLPLANIILLILKMASVDLSASAFRLSGFIVIALLTIILLYGLYNAYSPVVRKYEITVPKKKGKRSSLRIAMASDMHFGRLSGVSHAKRLKEKINELTPDIILLPGDIIDDEPGPFVEKNMGDILGQLKAPLGIFGVLGNHEYYGGQIPQFIEEMNRINIKILMDEVLTIDESFYLAGRKDKTDKRRQSFTELLEGIDETYPIIAMDHQPFELKQAQENSVDVLLSGHTHRGQMAPNHLITKRMYELDWGYLQKQQMHAFVSSGYGFWGPPFRIGSRSEILQIDIKFI